MSETMFEAAYEPKETILKDNYGGSRRIGKATLWRTENALKVLFCVDDNDIISYGKKYNEPLWKGDTAEMFLTLGRRNRYLELEVNPDGVGYAALVENRNGEFELEFVPEPPFRWETKRTEYGYESLWEIPFPELYRLGFRPEDAYFNLYVQDYTADGLKLYAMAPTGCGSFHRPESFVRFALKEK